jgi:hypothetical protein
MIIRRRHTANFTTISNVVFDDDRLLADEVGILGYLLSRPRDWEVRRPALQRRWGIGRDAMRRILTNLVRCGWCRPTLTRLGNGTYFMIYEIHDQPGATLSEEEVRRALSEVATENVDESRFQRGDDEALQVDQRPTGNPYGESGSPAPPLTPQPSTGHPSTARAQGATIDITNKDSPKTDLPNTNLDGGGDARARPQIENRAHELAEQLLVIAGHDPKFWPPGWCGAAARVQTWLTQDWDPEIILIAAKAKMARPPPRPIASVQFFETAIVEEIARQNRPLPEIPNVQTANREQPIGSPQRRGNAYARLAAKLLAGK